MNVVELQNALPTVSEQLRLIAKQIEDGEFPGTVAAALVLKSEEMQLFGLGNTTGPDEAHMMFVCAARKLEHAFIINRGGYKLG